MTCADLKNKRRTSRVQHLDVVD